MTSLKSNRYIEETRKLAAKDIIYTSDEAKNHLPFSNSKKDYSSFDIPADERTIFQHDCDAIVYSRSFRRLMHKTQVTYPGTDKDEHTRTRLTHTLEVNQIARAIARSLGLNLDLISAITLGHDLGHTPFGHEGEKFLDEFCRAQETTGNHVRERFGKYNLPEFDFEFKHNYQSVRVLYHWEGQHYDSETGKVVPGLNISRETAEGILKHSKILRDGKTLYRYPDIIEKNHTWFGLDKTFCIYSVEGQIVALADEIAQVTHDLEDAVEANYSVKHYLYQEITQFLNSPENSDYHDGLKGQWFMQGGTDEEGDSDGKLRINRKTVFHGFISWTVGYLIATAQKNIAEAMIKYMNDKEHYQRNYFPLTENFADDKIVFKNDRLYRLLKKIENTYIINNVRINRENGKADYILKSIIDAYLNKPMELPDSVLERYSVDPEAAPAIRKIIELKCNKKITPINIRYVFGKLDNEEEKEKLVNLLRNDKIFLRYLVDYVASMTDQFALNEYKSLYLGESAFRQM